jgi:hypothetical protein
VRSKTCCNRRFLEVTRRPKPTTIGGVKYSPLETGGGAGASAAAQELSPPTLTCEVTRIERERNRSVSEQVQRGSEVESVWCKNIFAENPLGPASPDHGEEVSGQVGIA